MNSKTINILAAIALVLILGAAIIQEVVANGQSKLNEADFTVGNYVQFGTYPQTSSGTDETPIEWLVLARDDDKALLISRYALDAKAYNDERVDITWEDCTLRTWLNGEFYDRAFSTKDKEHIVSTQVTAQDNPEYGTEAGNDTTDNVFLLSISEAEQYFESDDARICEATDYAIAQGAYVDSARACWWWLRSPGFAGFDFYYASNVVSGGSVCSRASFVSSTSGSVRPVVWVRFF